jgi:outer membrane lipoprotein carrier protein
MCVGVVALIAVASPSKAPARDASALKAAAPAAAQTVAQTASAQADTPLDRYLDGLTSLRTDFSQSITDASGKPAAGGSGSLIVERPNRFRWDYRPADETGAGGAGQDGQGQGGQGQAEPHGQLLVADGRNLWFYDRELAQVTVKPIDTALSSTPIMLLSGSSQALRAQFDISTQPSGQGLQWVQVRPRGPQADFSDARLGFRGNELERMIVHNMLGQTVQLDFTHSRRNAPVDASLFTFTVPQGVDVIGTPVPAGASASPGR